MASYVHRSTADREPKAPAPNITIYQTNPGHSHEVSRRDLKGSALVYALSTTCLEAMRQYKHSGGPISSAIDQLETLEPILVKQLQLIELANDSEIEPMRGLIVGTLADIAITIRALIAVKKDGSDEKKNRLEQSLSELLENEEVKDEVLDDPAYVDNEDNRDEQKDLVETCGRDIEGLISTLEDVRPVFFYTTESRHKNRNLWAEHTTDDERNLYPSRTTRVQVQVPSEYVGESSRVAEDFALAREREKMFEREHNIQHEIRQMPTIRRVGRSTEFDYRERSRRMSPDNLNARIRRRVS